MKCFYHKGDLDGQGSAAIIKKWCLEDGADCEFIGVEYGDDVAPLLESVAKGETVAVVDYTFEPFSYMQDLCNTAYVTWIDHHASSLKYVKDNKLDSCTTIILGDNSKSAIELTWEFLYPKKSVPRGIKFISLFDSWNHSDDSTILAFELSAINYLRGYDDQRWNDILEDNEVVIAALIKQGRELQSYTDKIHADHCESYAFDLTFEGIRFIAMNTPQRGSQQFKQVFDPNRHDAMMRFALTNRGHWSVAMYTSNNSIDLSIIAQKYSGGGHRGASGFIVKDISAILQSGIG